MTLVIRLTPVFLVAAGLAGVSLAEQETTRPARSVQLGRFVELYCIACHNSKAKTAGLELDALIREPIGKNSAIWERVVRKLQSRQMPPMDWKQRPDERSYKAALFWLETALDRAASSHPDPGRTETFRRLTRTEYQNAIRDLLSLEIDGESLLPADQSSNKFDTVTVGDLSPTLMDRYIRAAQKIARLAVGTRGRSPDGDTIRIRADRTQEEHVPGLPIGTRGGLLIPHTFPLTGEYEIAVRLARDRNEEVEGLHEPHELEILLDRQRVGLFTVSPPGEGEWHSNVDRHLQQKINVTAGPHQLGVTFLKKPSSLLVTKRQPYQAHFNMHRHPRVSPAIFQVSITGPFAAQPVEDTQSRRRVFICRPSKPADEELCARRIISNIMHRAYRRPLTEDDLKTPMRLFHEARSEGDFDTAIETALSAILLSPHFLFRIERDPSGVTSGISYRISDVDLASRLSFFIWSSMPDDQLLDLAERGQLSKPKVLERQVRRMLADPRAQALATNFAEQWLHLRNLDAVTPDLRLFPDFDDNLRQALREETELFFESILREDRSVLDLLTTNYTYLNERLAKHYNIPYVYGSRFRRVTLDRDSKRGGLLRHGSILTVTSYATRTSPVIRGKWVLENLLGNPPPPPPENVPALKDNTVGADLTVRERLAEHRANAACRSCHSQIDPVGFSLENFDAVGRWREVEASKPIDASGGLPDGSQCSGVDGLEKALMKRPELFVRTLTEKLLMFCLGRAVEEHDAPAVRGIIRRAQADNYHFSSIIFGITNSVPFRMRRAE